MPDLPAAQKAAAPAPTSTPGGDSIGRRHRAGRGTPFIKNFFIVFLAVIFLIPPGLLILQSLSSQWSWPNLLPEHWGLRGWRFVASQRHSVLRSLVGSFTYALSAVVLSGILCVSAAAALVRGNLRRRILIETLLLAPVMVPPVTFTLGIHHVFLHMGLTDRWIGVVFVLTAYSYPYMLRALMAGFEAIGEEYKATAINIGASSLRVTWEIELPLLIPALVSGGSVVFLVAFSDYYLVYLIGGGAVQGYSGFLFPFLTSSDRSVASVLTLVFLILPLALFFLIEMTLARWYHRRGMGGPS